MKEEFGNGSAAVGATALVMLLGGLTLAVYPGWEAIGKWLSEADGAGRVQAILAFVALLVAVAVPWIQRANEISDRRQIAVGGAKVAAAGVMLQLSPIVGAIASMRDAIEQEDVHPNRFLSVIDMQVWPTEQQLLLITAAAPKSAVRLARGRMLVEQAKMAFHLITHRETMAAKDYLDRLGDIDDLLCLGSKEYVSAQMELDALLDEPP